MIFIILAFITFADANMIIFYKQKKHWVYQYKNDEHLMCKYESSYGFFSNDHILKKCVPLTVNNFMTHFFPMIFGVAIFIYIFNNVHIQKVSDGDNAHTELNTSHDRYTLSRNTGDERNFGQKKSLRSIIKKIINSKKVISSKSN